MKETTAITHFVMNQISELNFQKIGVDLFRITLVILEDGILKKYIIPQVTLDSSDFIMKEKFKATENKIGQKKGEINFDFYGALNPSEESPNMELYEESYFKEDQ
jgi:hypothetical protein